MKKPPKKSDNANVLYWAWSGSVPFGFVGNPKDPMACAIYGLAICKYENSDEVYRFSCNKEWETEQDGLYCSVQEAMNELPQQYKNTSVNWIKYEGE